MILLAGILGAKSDCDCFYQLSTEDGYGLQTESADNILIENPITISWTATNTVTILESTNLTLPFADWNEIAETNQSPLTLPMCKRMDFFTGRNTNGETFTLSIAVNLPQINSRNGIQGTNVINTNLPPNP